MKHLFWILFMAVATNIHAQTPVSSVRVNDTLLFKKKCNGISLTNGDIMWMKGGYIVLEVNYYDNGTLLSMEIQDPQTGQTYDAFADIILACESKRKVIIKSGTK